MVLLTAILMLYSGVRTRWKDRSASTGDIADLISRYTIEGQPVLFISTTITAYPILLQMNRKPGSRYLSCFPIAMFYMGVEGKTNRGFPYHVGEDTPKDERRFLEELAQDIGTIRPRLIFVDDGGKYAGCPEGFVLKEYLRTVGFIETAMRYYRRIARADDREVFLLTGKTGTEKEP
jgi:hypothetical protein